MADATQLRKLIAYNEWADGRILTAIEGMTVEELERPVDAYFSSLARNLQHVLGAQRIWLARWTGTSPSSLDAPPVAELREAYAANHAALRAFVEPLSDTDADRVVSYRNTKGKPFQHPLSQLITHVVNHGTAHRAEVGMLLERIGRSPGDLDYAYFSLTR